MKQKSIFFDAACILSVIGIWPRFIEPRLLKSTRLPVALGSHLKGLKIVQLSDLHFHEGVPQDFLNKLARTIQEIEPDLILFTGDFICYARLEAPSRLQHFLNQLSAPLGCYCSFGNHDYAQYVTRDLQGNYIARTPLSPARGIIRGIQSLFSQGSKKRGLVTESARNVPLNQELCALLSSTPFTLLENKTVTLPIGLNITGLGDYALGRCLPESAFLGYDHRYPGIILSHNPDTFPLLANYPGNFVFSGHTHGEQIHLPFLRPLSRKLARLENPAYTRGYFSVAGKQLYVNRGIGSHKPFRLFSPPEVVVVHVTD